jgi:formate/nitrite transporter FocA (FNT family)
MLTMVDVELIEVNSRVSKRIKDNDEVAKRWLECKRGNLCGTVLCSISMRCAGHITTVVKKLDH